MYFHVCETQRTHMHVTDTTVTPNGHQMAVVMWDQSIIMWYNVEKIIIMWYNVEKYDYNVESNHILQPPNYLIIVVNRFRYINNQFAKDKCSIPMDMTVVLGYHKFSLQATIDHHGPSIYSGHYTTSVNCCNRTFYCNDNKITEFDMINTKNSSTAYVVIYKLIT